MPKVLSSFTCDPLSTPRCNKRFTVVAKLLKAIVKRLGKINFVLANLVDDTKRGKEPISETNEGRDLFLTTYTSEPLTEHLLDIETDVEGSTDE